MDTIAQAMGELANTSKNILEVQKEFNDNFLLHQKESEMHFENIRTDLSGMRDDFKNWFYPLFTKVVLGLLAIGGASVGLKLFGFW